MFKSQEIITFQFFTTKVSYHKLSQYISIFHSIYFTQLITSQLLIFSINLYQFFLINNLCSHLEISEKLDNCHVIFAFQAH